jgi:alcohol dehydrogenase
MRNCITIHGVWMYPREAIPRMIGMVRAGLLDLAQFAVTEFPLARANEAIAHAAANGGPFRMTVLKPAA